MLFLQKKSWKMKNLIKYSKIKKINKKKYTGLVYNLTTNKGTYFAENILNHNCAQTELQNARNHAKIDQVYKVNKDKPDSEIMVFKRPNPDGCPFCKSVYLENDGVTPKVFKLSEFKKNISNYK